MQVEGSIGVGDMEVGTAGVMFVHLKLAVQETQRGGGHVFSLQGVFS